MSVRVQPNCIQHDEKILAILKQKLEDNVITRFSPTTDHGYKRVFLHTVSDNEENKIGRSFANAILQLIMPEFQLSARKVDAMSENVNDIYRNFYLALRNFRDFMKLSTPQDAKVDALYCADMDDKRRLPRCLQTRSGNIPLKPAYVLVEAQVKEQDVGVRLLSYMCKIFSQDLVNLKDNQIPMPIYAASLCMWKEGDSLVKSLGHLDSAGARAEHNKAQSFAELAGCLVFLGKYEEIESKDTREKLDEKLQKRRICLKKDVVTYFSKSNFSDNDAIQEAFNKLSEEKKKVYLWLEFMVCAHLMQDRDVENSLSCLKNVEDKEPFQKAYDTVKLNFGGKNMDANSIKNQNPEIWMFGKLVSEVDESKRVATNNLLESVLEHIENNDENDRIQKWAHRVFSKNENLGIRSDFIEQFKKLVKQLSRRSANLKQDSDDIQIEMSDETKKELKAHGPEVLKILESEYSSVVGSSNMQSPNSKKSKKQEL